MFSHMRPQPLRHDFGDDYAHLAWGPNLELAAALALASPLYTLVNRYPIQRPNGSWEWRCRGRYLNGSTSGWTTESEYMDSFTCSTLCGSCITRQITGLDQLQSRQAESASQLNGCMRCQRCPMGLWYGGTSPINKDEPNVVEAKYTTTKLLNARFVPRIETRRGELELSKEGAFHQRLRCQPQGSPSQRVEGNNQRKILRPVLGIIQSYIYG